MKVAIDKNSINQIKDLDKKDCIYLFSDEKIDELLELKMHCIHKDYAYRIKDIKFPFKKDYKFAIIVPSFNNDHR